MGEGSRTMHCRQPEFISDARQGAEDAVEASASVRERERVDPAKIPLQKIQKALRSIAPEPGVEVKRDELFRRALPHVGRQRLTEPVRERFKSALRGLIQRGEFGYRGQDVVWRLRITAGDNTGTGNET